MLQARCVSFENFSLLVALPRCSGLTYHISQARDHCCAEQALVQGAVRLRQRSAGNLIVLPGAEGVRWLQQA